jgi:anti-anti-sigma factor
MSTASQVSPVQTADLGPATVVRLADEDVWPDGSNTQALAEKWLARLEPGQPPILVVDFGNVTFLTNATLGLLVSLRARLRAGGGRLFLANLAPQLDQLFVAARLHTLFDIRRDGGTTATAGSN